jgi:ATP-binding cassette subfamily C protein
VVEWGRRSTGADRAARSSLRPNHLLGSLIFPIQETIPSVPQEAAQAPRHLRARETFDQILVFIEPGQRAPWVAVALLACVVTGLEVASALLIFILARLLADPSASLVIPVVGDVREILPDASDDRVLIVVMVSVSAFFLVRAGVVLLQSYTGGRIAEHAGVRLSSRLLKGYLAMPYPLHQQRNSAELIRNVTDAVNDVVQYTLLPSVRLASELLVVGGLALTLALTSPFAAAVAVALFAPLMWLLFRFIQPRIAALGREDHDLAKSALLSLHQSLHGFRDIAILGRQEWFHERYARIRLAIARIRYLRWLYGDIPRIALETSLVLFVALFVAASVALGRSPAESVPVLGMFAYAGLRILPSLNHVVLEINGLRYGAAAAAEVHRDLVLLEAAAPQPLSPAAAEGQKEMTLRESIRLEGVGYRYPGASEDALADVNLEIRRGESIGVVGPTGSGKSTLIDVIVGLLPVASGRVLVDGTDIQSDLRGWQRNLGMVPQSVYLLDDSLRRNIALGVDDDSIDEDAVREAVALAQLGDFLASQPRGLDTVVGERGARLSGGERQRVAIARALYRHPDVLVLDEGTSALDSATEAALVEALASTGRERSMIVVAHRLTSVRDCSRILFVDSGRVVDSGAYDDLLARNAEFRRMARAAVNASSSEPQHA